MMYLNLSQIAFLSISPLASPEFQRGCTHWTTPDYKEYVHHLFSSLKWVNWVMRSSQIGIFRRSLRQSLPTNSLPRSGSRTPDVERHHRTDKALEPGYITRYCQINSSIRNTSRINRFRDPLIELEQGVTDSTPIHTFAGRLLNLSNLKVRKKGWSS